MDMTIIPVLLDMAAFATAGIYTMVVSHQLMEYLRKHIPERWSDLTSIFGIPGMNNGPKVLAYVWSRKDDQEETVRSYKRKVRKGMLAILLIWIGTIPIMYLCHIIYKLVHSGSFSR